MGAPRVGRLARRVTDDGRTRGRAASDGPLGDADDGPADGPPAGPPNDVSGGASDRSPGGLTDGVADGLERARALVAGASHIVVLTGAGVSAESGVPTFRGESGLWKRHRPEELATPGAFVHDPRLVWEWYGWRRGLVAACDPNPAHRALARLALKGHTPTTIVTQNVDGLHHRAADEVAEESGGGMDPTPAHPLEVHGAIHRDRCSGCGERSPGAVEVDSSSLDALPRCPACAELLRPDVVWFGEALDPDVIGAAFAAAAEADLCLVVGTSAVVHPAASVPDATLRAGGAVVEVNLEPTPLTPRAAVTVTGEAGRVVPALLEGPS